MTHDDESEAQPQGEGPEGEAARAPERSERGDDALRSASPAPRPGHAPSSRAARGGIRSEGEAPAEGGHSLRLVANVLAGGVAGQLSGPLRELRENLAVLVETLDRYVSEAPGPTPYPWKSLQALRQDLAQVYLLSRELARLACDLHESMTGVEGELLPIDVNKQVEAALNLARHRLDAHTEIFVDLGSLPPVRAAAGELVLAVAALILCCAESSAAREGSALSIRTYREHEGAKETVVISVADNGAGIPGALGVAERAVGPVMARLGGSFEGVSEPGQGSVLECRIPVIA